MESKAYIIDGYNLLIADPKIRSKINRFGQKAIVDHSQNLLESLNEFNSSSKYLVRVVFSGENPEVDFAAQQVNAIYSGNYISAGVLIKKMIDEYEEKDTLTVVTSDRSLISYAQLSGCSTLDSYDFGMMLVFAKKTISSSDEVPASIPIESNAQTKSEETISSQTRKPDNSFLNEFAQELDAEELEELMGNNSLSESYQGANTKNKDDQILPSENAKKNNESIKLDLSELKKHFQK